MPSPLLPHHHHHLLLLLLLSLLLLAPTPTQASHKKDRSSHHQHHPSKKDKEEASDKGIIFDRTTIPYCNIPNNITDIPPLSPEYTTGRIPGLKLLQVQAVARHGSRVPYSKYSDCWAGYGFHDWNCNVTEMTLPSQTDAGNNRSAPWIFRKIYDGSPTVLGGTCHLGQLVNEGFEQEAANGEALGRAYIGAGPLKLFATPHLGGVKAEAIYLRSDDDPSFRTEMSGEFLLRGMFNTQREITLLWHTGDFALDEIAPNPAVCPALSSVGQDAMASREWLQYNESDWVKDLDRRMEEELPGYKWEHMLDCLGTTSCTNRPFPSTLTKETLADAFQHGAMLKAFKFAWNDAYYSKLGIGPFMKELLDNMRARVQGSSALRFGLFLGHDTSVLPLLAALGVWEGVWPPYSSLLVFELYEGEGDQYFFRLVYDGKELIMDECDGKALCRFEVLEQVVTPWALATGDPRRACAVVTEEFDYEEEEEEDGKGSSIMVHLRAAEAEEKKGGEAGGETNTTTTAPPTAPAPVVNEPTPTTNKSSNKANGGGIGGVHLFLAVFFSLLVGILFGIVMTLSWAERRQRETGNPGPYHHPIGNGSGWGWLDRLSASLRGSSSASYSSV